MVTSVDEMEAAVLRPCTEISLKLDFFFLCENINFS